MCRDTKVKGSDIMHADLSAETNNYHADPGSEAGSRMDSGQTQQSTGLLSQGVLRGVASLWFAGVVLVLLLVAMACATVYESMHGTERALAIFYRSDWFTLLIVLLGVNVTGALLVRLPFTRRQIGFVITHLSILLILVGSLTTRMIGQDGQVGLAEGQSVDSFTIPIPTLTVAHATDDTQSKIDLNASVFTGYDAVDKPSAPTLVLGSLQVEIQQYLPDSTLSEHIVTDEQHGRPAVEASLAAPGSRGKPVWVFVGEKETIGPLTATLLSIADDAELAALLEKKPSEHQGSLGTVKIEHEGSTFEIPLEDCTDEAFPLGETGTSVRLLRYLPHAMVGADRKLTSASDKPVNPAIEVVLTGPDGPVVRRAFARFPDFGAVHGGKQAEAFKVTFVASSDTPPTEPIEILAGPGDSLHVRFQHEGQDVVTSELVPGEPVDTPWPGLQFTVLRPMERVQKRWRIVPVEAVRETRIPAILVQMSTEEYTSEMWLQKYQPRSVTVDGQAYELVFHSKQVPLGFSVTLNDFEVGRYPGEMRPRSFESDITIVDPETGRSQGRVVSMNRPVKHGGYTFYQSSFREEGKRMISFLSVSRDPGQIVVFAGYITLMIGMIVVLITRATGRRRAPAAVAGLHDEGGIPRP